MAKSQDIPDIHQDNAAESTASIASPLGVDERAVRYIRKVYKYCKQCMTETGTVSAKRTDFDDNRRAINDLVVLYIIYCKYSDCEHRGWLVAAILHIAGEKESSKDSVLQVVH